MGSVRRAARRWGIMRTLPKSGRLALGLLFLALPSASAENVQGVAPLDLSACRPTFDENFRQLSVSPWGRGTRWIAHTPWHGDFGDAPFADPQPGFPFIAGPDGLKIEARKDAHGRWEAGLLSTVDDYGEGFTQSYGYFEMRAKMPSGEGVWPAFWLVTNGPKGLPSVELDVMEYYGHLPDRYFVTTHVWYKDKQLTREAGDKIRVEAGSLSDAFHTYGVSVSPTTLVYYLDRREVFRQPTPPELKRPLGLLVDLALGGGWPIDKTPNPSIFQVDYVRAYPLLDSCAH